MSTVNFTVVRADTKNVLDENGTISSVAANTPAFEYNANGTYKGLLVESASENICLQSEDWSLSPWENYTLGAGVTPTTTADAGVSPDGTSNATRIQLDCGDDTSSGNRSARRQPITISNSTDYTVSFWYKAYDASAIGDTIRVENSYLGIPSIITLSSEWQRYTFTGTSINTTTSVFLETRGTFTGQTADVLVWGAQLEEGSVASSYIPTTTVSVERVKDDISLTSASSYIGQTAGTIYLEATIDNIVDNANLISVSDGSDDNIVRMTFNASGDMRMYVKAAGASIINDVETISAGTYKFAVVYSSGDTRVYRDGVQLSSDTTSFTFGATVEEIDIGQNFAATGQAENWIKAFAFYKRALTDAEALILTN